MENKYEGVLFIYLQGKGLMSIVRRPERFSEVILLQKHNNCFPDWNAHMPVWKDILGLITSSLPRNQPNDLIH